MVPLITPVHSPSSVLSLPSSGFFFFFHFFQNSSSLLGEETRSQTLPESWVYLIQLHRCLRLLEKELGCGEVIIYRHADCLWFCRLFRTPRKEGFTSDSVGKNLSAHAEDTGLIPGLVRSYTVSSNKGHVPQWLRLCSRLWELQLWRPVLRNTRNDSPHTQLERSPRSL